MPLCTKVKSVNVSAMVKKRVKTKVKSVDVSAMVKKRVKTL